MTINTDPQTMMSEDKGPWKAGETLDGRAFVESFDFTHDVRLYIDGDFAGASEKLEYARRIAARLSPHAGRREALVEQVARKLYECELERSDHGDAVLSAAKGSPVKVGMEPWEESAKVYRGDAMAVLAVIFGDTPPQDEMREALRKAEEELSRCHNDMNASSFHGRSRTSDAQAKVESLRNALATVRGDDRG